METLIDSIIDFVRVRQLNIAVGLTLSLFFLSDLTILEVAIPCLVQSLVILLEYCASVATYTTYMTEIDL